MKKTRKEVSNKQIALFIWLVVSFMIVVGLYGPLWFEVMVVANFGASVFFAKKHLQFS